MNSDYNFPLVNSSEYLSLIQYYVTPRNIILSTETVSHNLQIGRCSRQSFQLLYMKASVWQGTKLGSTRMTAMTALVTVFQDR